MGNRAVITTQENFENNGIGIYLHWNGDRDSVEAFLEYCKRKGYRAPNIDNYGWAYLCATIANFFGSGLSIGIDSIDKLDINNHDNGTYIIEGWDIVERKFFYGEEWYEYDIEEMIKKIDESQPERMRL